MKFVIDTSVAVKWFLSEAEHEAAVMLLATKAEFLAPDLVFTEFASAMQKKMVGGEASREQAFESCASLPTLFVSIVPTLLLFQRALEIGTAMTHPVQDCIFLACAERAGIRVVSADRKLIEKASKRGFAHLVFGLREAVEAADPELRDASIPAEDLRDLVRLSDRLDATLAGLGAIHTASRERFHFVPAEVFGRAFEAPAYLRLRDMIAGMADDHLRDLVALCWLGRGYDGTDWPRLQDMAKATLGRTPSEITYVLSLLSYLQAGIDRARAFEISSAETHRDA